jgi:hypothetical protein
MVTISLSELMTTLWLMPSLPVYLMLQRLPGPETVISQAVVWGQPHKNTKHIKQSSPPALNRVTFDIALARIALARILSNFFIC